MKKKQIINILITLSTTYISGKIWWNKLSDYLIENRLNSALKRVNKGLKDGQTLAKLGLNNDLDDLDNKENGLYRFHNVKSDYPTLALISSLLNCISILSCLSVTKKAVADNIFINYFNHILKSTQNVKNHDYNFYERIDNDKRHLVKVVTSSENSSLLFINKVFFSLISTINKVQTNNDNIFIYVHVDNDAKRQDMKDHIKLVYLCQKIISDFGKINSDEAYILSDETTFYYNERLDTLRENFGINVMDFKDMSNNDLRELVVAAMSKLSILNMKIYIDLDHELRQMPGRSFVYNPSSRMITETTPHANRVENSRKGKEPDEIEL